MRAFSSVIVSVFLLLAACSTSQHSAETEPIDPVTDPTIVGAIDEALVNGTIEGEAAAESGRRIGRVAGVLAAVFGGPESESVGEIVDRYRRTRDAVEDTSVLIGTTKGVIDGARRGYELDLQFAELHAIEGIEVTRPYPDEIRLFLASGADAKLLAKIAAVFEGGEQRAIDVHASGDEAVAVRESLVALGLSSSCIAAHRDDELEEVFIRVRYRS